MQFTSDFVQTMTQLANTSFFEAYDAEPVVYPQVFKVQDVKDIGEGKNYGKMTTIIGDDEPDNIGFAQDHKFFDIGEGYTAPWATKLYQRGFEITQEMLRDVDELVAEVDKLSPIFIVVREVTHLHLIDQRVFALLFHI